MGTSLDAYEFNHACTSSYILSCDKTRVQGTDEFVFNSYNNVVIWHKFDITRDMTRENLWKSS